MPYELKESERTVQAMIYTPFRLCWGNLVHPMGVRPQNWLKMTMVPDHFVLLEANILLFGGQQPVRLPAPEMHLPVNQILAFHLIPPYDFELDYDPQEPNRQMKPVSVNVDVFRFDGNFRISSIADFSFSIRGGGKSYRSLYDVTISHPLTPGIKALQVPHALIRSDVSTYMITP